MKVIDLFCGCGGFSEGFKQAGFDIVAAVDNWQLSLDSHQANHPHTKHLNKDIREIKAKDLEKYKADVILGSPPCQDFSVANYNPDAKRGLELTDCFLDLIEELNPKFWIMENVTGVLKHIKGRIIKLGGRNHILNSADYGVPQIRKRVFCGKFPFPYPTHAKKPNTTLVGNLKKWLVVKDALKDVPLPEDENLELTEKGLERALAILRKDKVPYVTAIVEGHKPSHTITAHIGRDFSTGGIINTSFYGRHGPNFYSDNKPSPTLTAKGGIFHIIQDDLRRLSTIEAKILMGFPLEYIISGNNITVKFKQIGNAVCPPVSRAIAKAIIQVEN